MLIKKCIMKSKDSFLCFSFFINYGKILWVINMKISKSLFKNLSRCENMASLYDMYMYKNLNEMYNKDQFLVPYLMSSHPGSTLNEAVNLALYLKSIEWSTSASPFFSICAFINVLFSKYK